MKLKNLSKWLKFGLLFMGIYLFLFIISILFFGWGGGILIITISPTTWIQQADNVAINYLGDWDSFNAVFLSAIGWFLIGALIGLIIQKISYLSLFSQK